MPSRRILVTAAVACLVAPQTASAVSFASGSGRFTVMVPAKPTHSKNVVPSNVGQLSLESYVVEAKDGAYFVSFTDYPTGVATPDNAQEMLDGVVEGMVASKKGTLIKSAKIQQGGFPGREVVFSLTVSNLAMKGHARVFLVGDRLYQVFVMGRPPFVEKVAPGFLKSFTFQRPPAAPKPAKPAAPVTPSPTPNPAPARAVDTSSWITFGAENNDGGYHVRLPEKPVQGQEPGILGTRNRTVFTTQADGLTFRVIGQVVPPAALNKGPKAVLDASRDALAADRKGVVRAEQTAKVGEFPARDFAVAAAGPGSDAAVARSVLVGRRLYTLLVTGRPANMTDPRIEAFMESFKPTAASAPSR